MENKKLAKECKDGLTGMGEERTLKKEVRAMLLREQGATREEISKTLNISDRTARNLIAQIGRNDPVILLNGKGYKLIDPDHISEDDEKALEHTLASLMSRSREILKRASILKMAINKIAVRKTFEEARKENINARR